MFKDRIKELRRVKAKELLAHPKNWRTHPKGQRDALSGILTEVGFVDAVMARVLGNGQLQVIDGHLRSELDPEFEVPVLIVDLNDEETDKILATFDPLASMASVNKENLDALLRSFQTSSPELQKMMVDLAQRNHCDFGTPVTTEDDVPLPLDKAVTQKGDIWILGNHRLMCGDSSDPEQLDRLLAGARIHLANTDPPYNVKVEPRSNNAIAAGLSSFEESASSKRQRTETHHQGLDLARHPGKSKPTHKKMRAKDRPLANDFVTDEAFDDLLQAWFGNIARVLDPGRSFYIWGGYANCANYPPVLKANDLYFSQAIIWIKEHPVLTRKDFMGNHEWCFYGWKEGAAHVFLGPANIADTWSVKKVNPQSMVHLTEKPVELAARAMDYSSRENENVLDLFGGSGSTLIAAEQRNRHAFLMELDVHYADVIVMRWSKLTGRDAVCERADGSKVVWPAGAPRPEPLAA